MKFRGNVEQLAAERARERRKFIILFLLLALIAIVAVITLTREISI